METETIEKTQARIDKSLIKVLLIEDDEIDRKAFKRLVEIENLPYNLAMAGSVSEAKALLCSEKFDVVIADYMLGDGTAFELFELVKDAPVVITTGAGDEETAVKAMKAGACDYLIKDAQRNYLKVLPFAIDSTIKNKRTADDLKRTHSQNEQLLKAVPLILIGIGSDYRITHWNQAAERAFGIQAVDIVGRPFLDCGIQWDWARIASWITDYHRSTDWSTLEGMRYSRPDGKAGYLSMKLNPFSSETAEQSGSLFLAEDITNRRIMEHQLSEAQKLKSMGQLAAGIAHEINTPLQHIADNRVTTIISDFDKISRADVDRTELKQTEDNLRLAASEVLEALLPLSVERRVN